MSLSEAAEVIADFIRKDAKSQEGRHPPMTRREIEALTRLLTDTNITLQSMSRGDRRAGRGSP